MNEWIAVKLTNGVGSMWCAYAFLIWALLPLAFPSMSNVVQYVSQSVVQLVLLSVILVGQDISNRSHEQRDNESHDAVMAELTEIKDMHGEIHQLLKRKEDGE